MSEKTKIAWCDSTVNFWSGCTMVSPGCAHCYAEVRDRRHMVEPVSHWGKGAPRLKHVGAVKQALAMNRKPWVCAFCGEGFANFGPHQCKDGFRISIPESAPMVEHLKSWHRRRIFSLSLGDWLDDEVPIEWLAEMLDTIRQCDQVVWILCTKRPENWCNKMKAAIQYLWSNQDPSKMENRECCSWLEAWLNGAPPEGVWLLTSVENQAMADKRIPELLKIPAVVHGLSLEPLLANVTLDPNILGQSGSSALPRIDWLIIGGESGKDARPCNVDWIRSLVIQGREAGVATFVKQFGARPLLKPCGQNHFDWKYKTANAKRPDNKMFKEDGDMWRILFTDKKGGDPAEWMDHYRVQEFPVLAIDGTD